MDRIKILALNAFCFACYVVTSRPVLNALAAVKIHVNIEEGWLAQLWGKASVKWWNMTRE